MFVDKVEEVASDGLIAQLNLKEPLHSDTLRFSDLYRNFDRMKGFELVCKLLENHKTYPECLHVIEDLIFQMISKNDLALLQDVACLKKLPEQILKHFLKRICVQLFHECLLFTLRKENIQAYSCGKWHSGDVQSLMNNCSPILHPRLIELRDQLINWELLSNYNGLFDL